MSRQPGNRHPILSSKYLPLAVIGLALSILGGTILWASLDLRRKSREQITRQYAQVLYAVWLNQALSEEAEASGGLQTATDPVVSVLETARSRLPQLAVTIGTRIFDAHGNLLFCDPNISKSALTTQDFARLERLQPVARFRPAADLSEVNILLADTSPRTGPLLEVCIPLHAQNRKELLGAAQFILDGAQVAAEFRTLDRNLLLQGALAFLAGGGVLVLVLGLSFRQLQRLNRLLIERTQGLLRANQELALAAKTSAVGAVTAHLIHGLKNPLSGLQSFMATRGSLAENGDESEWQMAVSSTRRMQSMVSEIVRVLRDEQVDSGYELSLEEFMGMLNSKVQPMASEAGIQFSSEFKGEAVLSNREANLLSLILFNLVQNAIQATPNGKAVRVAANAVESRMVWEVSDQGPGVPPVLQQALFVPCRSSKEGGSGVGLAISKQLAGCIGAELELKRTSAAGSVFVLSFARTKAHAEQDGLASRTAVGLGSPERPSSA